MAESKAPDKRLSVSIFYWLIIVIAPFLLSLLTIRLLLTWDSPSYPEFEYPRISPDKFGFTNEERAELAEATLEYLRQEEPAGEVIFMLEQLRLPGTDQPLYNPREIEHMLDVKELADTFQQILQVLGIFYLVGIIYLMARPETRIDAYRGIMYGGLLTTGILLVMVILIFVAWNLVFTQFHELLFPPDSWTFFMDDSLIRLFPEQFWFDFGLIWTVGILIQGLFLALVGFGLKRWSQRSKPGSEELPVEG
jgi:integral membrane protein (TIGR01906 family)